MYENDEGTQAMDRGEDADGDVTSNRPIPAAPATKKDNTSATRAAMMRKLAKPYESVRTIVGIAPSLPSLSWDEDEAKTAVASSRTLEAALEADTEGASKEPLPSEDAGEDLLGPEAVRRAQGQEPGKSTLPILFLRDVGSSEQDFISTRPMRATAGAPEKNAAEPETPAEDPDKPLASADEAPRADAEPSALDATAATGAEKTTPSRDPLGSTVRLDPGAPIPEPGPRSSSPSFATPLPLSGPSPSSMAPPAFVGPPSDRGAPSSALRTAFVFLGAAAIAVGAYFALPYATSQRSQEPAAAAHPATEPGEAEEALVGVRVHAGPEGATLRIDGTDHGPLPATVELGAGRYAIVVEAPGFEPYTRTVEVPAGTLVDLGDVTLVAQAGSLTVSDVPPGARVLIAHRDRMHDPETVPGPFPATLDVPGPGYRLVVTRAGYQDFVQDIPVDPEGVEVRVEMFRKVDASDDAAAPSAPATDEPDSIASPAGDDEAPSEAIDETVSDPAGDSSEGADDAISPEDASDASAAKDEAPGDKGAPPPQGEAPEGDGESPSEPTGTASDGEAAGENGETNAPPPPQNPYTESALESSL